jgi:protein arginine kinase
MSETVTALLRHLPPWLEASGPQPDQILSARVRLARNIKGVPFVPKARPEELRSVLSRVQMAAQAIPAFREARTFVMEELSVLERQFLFERHLVSRDMTVGAPHQAALVSPDETVCIMVNEEDHLRLQSLASGFRLQEAFEEVNRLDDEISERLEMAFHEELGYLTSCPTNVGTGLRASVLVHLPALVLTRKIRKVLTGVHQVGLSVRGFWGEGSDVLGNFFQISNQVTLGERETQTLRNLDRVIRQVLEYEEKAREVLMREARWEMEDKIGRAYGTLLEARLLSSQELIGLLSAVRFGITLGLEGMPDLRLVNELLVLGQPAHVQLLAGREMGSAERNRFRARMVRERMAGRVPASLDPKTPGETPRRGGDSDA